MVSNELIELGSKIGSLVSTSTPFGITSVSIVVMVVVVLLLIGFEEEDFYDMFQRHENRKGNKKVPVLNYKDDGTTMITYEYYNTYLTKWGYEWAYISIVENFGWVERPKPKVSLFMSPGMEEKINKIFKKDEKSENLERNQ